MPIRIEISRSNHLTMLEEMISLTRKSATSSIIKRREDKVQVEKQSYLQSKIKLYLVLNCNLQLQQLSMLWQKKSMLQNLNKFKRWKISFLNCKSFWTATKSSRWTRIRIWNFWWKQFLRNHQEYNDLFYFYQLTLYLTIIWDEQYGYYWWYLTHFIVLIKCLINLSDNKIMEEDFRIKPAKVDKSAIINYEV